MEYYALTYFLTEDYMQRRQAYRAEHLGLAQGAVERGELVLGGAFSDPADKALLLFRVANKQRILDFVQQDPYVQNGIVERWEIRPWTVVIGSAYEEG